MLVRIAAVAGVLMAGAALAQQGGGGHSGHGFSLPPDPRTVITFPPEVRDFFRSEMRGHLDQLNTLIGLLGEGDMKKAGEFARTGLAVAGNHPPGAPSPGRYAPPEFRAMGQAMHKAAGEIDRVASAAPTPPTAADWKAVTAAVGTLTSACAGCHATFRVQ